MNFNKILKFKVTCIVIYGGEFNETIIEIIRNIQDKKICYITLNKGIDALLSSFEENKINIKNISILDCVSETVFSPKPEPNCTFISSPKALTELSLAINNCINSNSSIILIDSLSTLMIYHDAETINKFVHNLSNRARTGKDKHLIIFISDKDKNSEVFKKIEIIVDKVIEVGKKK
jgi:archaellum biogenesis ATPase FlaH